MNVKKKVLTHCCDDCVFKTVQGCFFNHKEFEKQPTDKVNTCEDWQN